MMNWIFASGFVAMAMTQADSVGKLIVYTIGAIIFGLFANITTIGGK